MQCEASQAVSVLVTFRPKRAQTIKNVVYECSNMLVLVPNDMSFLNWGMQRTFACVLKLHCKLDVLLLYLF